MVRDKIFTEFLKETSESDSVHYVTKSSDSWQKVPSLDGSVEDDLERIRSEADFVNAMTMGHSQEETLESSEQLGKIISSEPTDDRG